MASAKHLPIKIDRKKIAAFCRTHGIGRLSLFGSILRDDFDPIHSDVDVLVEFLPGRTPGWEFFVWHEELEVILGHKVEESLIKSVGHFFAMLYLRQQEMRRHAST